LNPAARRPGSSDPELDAVGFVLAGGRSSRMGRDKALLELAGRPLIAHALSVLQEAALSPRIAGVPASARTELAAFAPVVEDAAPGLGPLSGICAALAATCARYAVFLPVDLPLIPASLLAFLLRHARTTGHAVTVPAVAGFAQTFPAVVDRAALPALENELSAERYGCFSAFQAACAALRQPLSAVAVELLAQAGQVSHPRGLPTVYWFLNLNTPQDLARIEELGGRRIA
jgi:molybdenum cofactor guanylyltransferase